MKRIILMLLLIVAACQPIAPAATPTMVPVPTITATPLPDPSGSNPHANLPAFSPINKNWTLEGRPVLVEVGHDQVRTLAIPPQWSYVGVNEVYPNVPPYVYLRDDLGGYQFEPAYVSGTFGLAQDGIELFPEQRYIVKITYTTDLSRINSTGSFLLSDFTVQGAVYNTSGGTTTGLTPQTIPALRSARNEQIWVIESDKPFPTIRLEVFFKFRWATLQGGIIVHKIEILTAPADYGSNAVLRF